MRAGGRERGLVAGGAAALCAPVYARAAALAHRTAPRPICRDRRAPVALALRRRVGSTFGTEACASRATTSSTRATTSTLTLDGRASRPRGEAPVASPRPALGGTKTQTTCARAQSSGESHPVTLGHASPPPAGCKYHMTHGAEGLNDVRSESVVQTGPLGRRYGSRAAGARVTDYQLTKYRPPGPSASTS